MEKTGRVIRLLQISSWVKERVKRGREDASTTAPSREASAGHGEPSQRSPRSPRAGGCDGIPAELSHWLAVAHGGGGGGPSVHM